MIEAEFSLRITIKQDAEQLAFLYKQVFQIYPSPLDQPKYVEQAILEDTHFV